VSCDQLEDRDDFSRDGFVFLKGFLEPRETAAIRMAVESLRLSPSHGGCTRPNNTLQPLRWDQPIVQMVIGSELRRQILGLAVGAGDLRWISGYISTKEPQSPPLWWHQDWWCWDHPVSFRRQAAQVAVLCYLTQADRHNGALRILPCSHRASTPIHAILPEAHGRVAGGLEPEHQAMSDIDGQLTVRVQAGDAIAIDYRLLHGTHANTSNSRRDCILLSFTPSWCQLPDDIQGHLIDHPAQPTENEMPGNPMQRLLPHFSGVRRSLILNRNAPREFNVD
jgi:hypothetical protein